MISYNKLDEKYKNAVEFCLKNLILLENFKNLLPNNSLNNLLNKIKETEITLDVSPYFCIIKFYYEGFTEFHFEKTFDVIIVHNTTNKESNEYSPDTVISAHFTRSMLVEIEIYNVDSSAIDWDNLFIGEIDVMDSLT